MTMSWNQITVDVPYDLKDAVIGELSDDGVAGVWETDLPLPGMTRLVLYFSLRCNLENVETRVRAIFGRSSRQIPPMSRSVVEESDWTGEWKKSYTSFPLGDDFSIIPSWEDASCPMDRLPIR